jgi:hypothetical protein
MNIETIKNTMVEIEEIKEKLEYNLNQLSEVLFFAVNTHVVKASFELCQEWNDEGGYDSYYNLANVEDAEGNDNLDVDWSMLRFYGETEDYITINR